MYIKKTLSVILVLVLAVTAVPHIGLTQAFAAGYNASAAVAYAASHWNDGVGECAEFVSNCLKAGGINVMQKVCDNLYNTLVNNSYGTAYVLTTSNSKISMSTNSGKLSAGDPVFYYCNTCKSCSHVVLCGGTDGSGNMTDYAHNNPHNNTTTYINWACSKCKTINWTMKSVHIAYQNTTPAPITTLSIPKNTFTTGESIPVSWQSSGNPYSTWLGLYKQDQTQVYAIDVTGQSSHTITGLPVGDYLVYVDAANMAGSALSNVVYFSVVAAPTAPITTLSIPKNTFITGESIPVSWQSSGNPYSTWLGLYKQDQTSVYSLDVTGQSSHTITGLPVGDYLVYVDAANMAGSVLSNIVYFSVVPNTYTVMYNANGGSGAPSNQTKIYGTDITLSSDKPTKSGYTFTGWNTKADGSGTAYASGAVYTANADLTLYAQWTAATLSSITVKTNPTKTSYNVGDTLNTAGLTLTATYSDNTTQTVSSGFTCSPTTLNTAGTQKITVTYQGKTATFNVTVTDNTASAKYTVSSAKAAPGGTVVLTVSVANNPGIISLRNTVTFDGTALELISVENLALLNGYTTPSPTMTSPYTLRWADSFATANNTKNGALVKLTFKVKDTAPKGSYTVTAVNTEARNVSGDTVAFASGVGTVTVTNVVSGDADGDGEVTDWDAILLNRYLAGWSVTVNEAACDVSGNDGINDWDAIVLERYLAGWSVTLG